MSHARFARPRYTLSLDSEGGAELTVSGKTLWASDADADFVEAFGDDLIGDYDAADSDEAAGQLICSVFDYLVERDYLTDAEADDAHVYIPEDDDDDDAVLGPANSDEGEADE